MIKNILYLLMLFCGFSSAQEKLLKVVPQPKEYQFTGNHFKLDGTSLNINLYCSADEPISIALADLKKSLSGKFKITWNNSSQSGNILLGLPAEDAKFKEVCEKNGLMPGIELGDEGYLLLIEEKKIIVSANHKKGLFYAAQTLMQIINGIKDESYLPGLRILDYPDMKFRAIMDDISRGPIPTMDYMKYQIRRFASLKINAFTHYVEHVVKTKSHPEFAPDDGSLTIEDWKELSEYGKKYNVTLVGGFQSFGHFNSILASPKYSHLGESGTLLSPVLKESYDFLEDIYSEMVPAFDAPFFNIHCDETFDLGKGASKKMVDSIGYDGVFLNHIMKIYNIFKKLNTKIMMWGDIPLEYPELLKVLPKDIIIGTWVYDDLDSFEKYIKPFKDNGFQLLICPGVLNSSRLFPDYSQTFGNIKKFVIDGNQGGAGGMINAVWDDGGAALFSNDWYGAAFAADRSWNPFAKDSVNFDSRFSSAIYGCSNEMSYTKAIWKLMELSLLEPTDAMNDKILFEKLLPDSGRTVSISTNDWQKVINLSNQAAELLGLSKPNIHREDKESLSFVCSLYNSLGQERFRIIDASDKYIHATAIAMLDSKQAKQFLLAAIDSINCIINDFTRLKNDFKKLWLRENHSYALDRVTSKYDEKIKDYVDVKLRLLNSLNKFENGLELQPVEQIRLGVKKLPGKYFREWLMVTPFTNTDTKQSSETDFLLEMGGEHKAVPKVTQEFFYKGEKHRWGRTASPYQDVVNLKETFQAKNNNAVVYAFATLDSPKETNLTALIGCDDGAEVILNGVSMFRQFSESGFNRDEHSFSLPLKKGVNNLMIKLFQTDGDWAFSFRLSGCEVRSRKNRYKIIEE